ncbi:MAG: hypothetical protein H8D56_21210 [Planctomycetes bacterium]|nr:hypothetical protein [Planctomycetota bacterium]MBL7145575.1 hypothetical protein [Phycisphaerae bacterium]
MKKRIVQEICLCLMLAAFNSIDTFAADSKPTDCWIRTVDLGTKPKHITNAFPLSDQSN